MPQEFLIANIKACVFDAYGTLFDVHSAVGKYNERLGDVSDQVSNIWRTKQLEYTGVVSQYEFKIEKDLGKETDNTDTQANTAKFETVWSLI